MHTNFRDVLPVLLSACSLLVASSPLSAQDRGDGDAIRIQDIDFEYLKAPAFVGKSVPAATREHDWLQILIDYRADGGRDEWIDELTLDWNVAIEGKEGKPLLLEKTVDYTDVEEGDRHAVVYVRPGFLRRYYGDDRVSSSDIFVHIDVRINGRDAGYFDYARTRVPDKWWEFREPRIIYKEGELFNRLETPFANHDYDYFQHIKAPGK